MLTMAQLSMPTELFRKVHGTAQRFWNQNQTGTRMTLELESNWSQNQTGAREDSKIALRIRNEDKSINLDQGQQLAKSHMEHTKNHQGHLSTYLSFHHYYIICISILFFGGSVSYFAADDRPQSEKFCNSRQFDWCLHSVMLNPFYSYYVYFLCCLCPDATQLAHLRRKPDMIVK